ncbi:hypothetical protein F6X37_16445 [Paraburkholderia sp. 31.1]|uniref:hypothetical protein n=1 Tax=Paraburkholderia sp. 31.1 TaxID=2615205 RepID=UPI0016567451|nr:hypothetical protein [Paraburkholderia sp. 31.1]MBC8723117.1 hypothetical protein [Paraburkholderia sp. 31.1]
MTYFVDIFSVDTFESFSNTSKNTAGFHPNRKAWVTKIKPGDKILCYLKGLSCWVGILQVTGPMAEAPPGSEMISEYSLQFPVTPLVWLEKGALLPIKRSDVWAALSFTKNVTPGAGGWNAILRSSGVRLQEPDGQRVEELLRHQAHHLTPDDIADETWEKHRSLKMTNASGKVVAVQIPLDEQEAGTPQPDALPSTPCEITGSAIPASQVRTSHKMQALLADIGIAMGFEVWIPKADKEAVLSEMNNDELLTALPYTQFSEAARKTVEQIDVLWLQKKAIVRAFEVEHTTSVYSGILRMADLLALQPNFHTRLHIVAPEERRKKVFQELMRPAFSIFPQGPLSELCSYLPYEKVQDLAANPTLDYLKQEVLDKYEEFAEEAE